MAEPPSRPRTLTPGALGFRPQPSVSWLNPDVLVSTGLRAMWSNAFGSFLDKRELEEAIAAKPDTRWAERDELWLDYLADTGDGFDATYSVAQLLARRELHVREGEHGIRELPRGEMLVLGGDQVYPTATAEAYTNRFTGPFRAALPWSEGDHPTLLALPGNHDWYDGLTGFLRLFAQGRWIGGWRTTQTRSYFAVQLPHRWWLWGMDILADEYIDGPQLRFFSQALDLTEPGDRMILAVPTPTWVDARNVPEEYRNLAFVENSLLRPHGVELRLTLAGNLHHYSRYSAAADAGPPPHGPAGGAGAGADADGSAEPDVPAGSEPGRDRRAPAHKITSGGGGAFLHPTHDLPLQLRIPEERGASTVLMDSAGTRQEQRSAVRTYELAACFPSRPQSRTLALRALLLGVRNPTFMAFVALVNVALLWINQFGLRTFTRDQAPPSFVTVTRQATWTDLAWGLARNPFAALLVVAMAVGLVTMVRTPRWARRRWQARTSRLALGLTHAALHVVVVVTVALVSLRLADALFSGGWFVLTANVADAVLGGLLGATALGAYLTLTNVAPGLRANGNEAFSAARVEGYKNFLRLRVDREGRLTVYAVGLDRVAHRWRPDPDNPDPEAAWLAPADAPLRPHLVDLVTID
jgi:hypothetical protein